MGGVRISGTRSLSSQDRPASFLEGDPGLVTQRCEVEHEGLAPNFPVAERQHGHHGELELTFGCARPEQRAAEGTSERPPVDGDVLSEGFAFDCHLSVGGAFQVRS